VKQLIQIPALRDNYIYMAVHDDGQALVVDPADADPVLAWLSQHPEVTLKAVINTHHHADHVGGNEKLKHELGVEIFGASHDKERVVGITQAVSIGQHVVVAGFALEVLDVKAHTLGHIAYKTREAFDRVVRHGHGGEAEEKPGLAEKAALFVGDSLFLGGCGRLFEGSADNLAHVMQLYHQMDGDHLVCCAHEYTASNLRFAEHALPNQTDIQTRLGGLEKEMGQAKSSVPDTLHKEFVTNPFILGLSPPIAESYAQRHNLPNALPATVLGAMRRHKDAF
jgi:hydroxyacylglutathione hydrolase